MYTYTAVYSLRTRKVLRPVQGGASAGGLGAEADGVGARGAPPPPSPSIYLSIYLSLSLSLYLSFYLSIFLSIYLSICTYVLH